MKTLGNNVYMLKCVARYTPGFFFWTIVEGLVWGCIHSFTAVLFVRAVFDRIESGEFADILVLVVLMAAFFAVAYVFHQWYWQFIAPRAGQALHLRMQSDLFNKARELDLACYDNPSFYTDFVWAINEADDRAIRVAYDFGKVINRLFSTSVIVGVLLTIDVLIVLAICAAVGITVGLKVWRASLQFKRDLETKPIQRKADYIGRVFYLADYAKEIRLSQAEDILQREFDEAVAEKTGVIKRYGSKLFAIATARSVTTSMLFDVAIILLLVYKIMVEQSITLGDFAASVSAVWKLFWQIGDLMEYIAKVREHSLYAEKFKVFLNYRPTVRDNEGAKTFAGSFEGLELENVCFTYPDTDNAVLKNISLSIRPGEKIAFVGYNGAGKSTLVKLIMRLYDPVSGAIKANGEDICGYTIESYRGKFGAVFQDFQIFAASIAENILADEYGGSYAENETVLQALRQSGFGEKLDALPNGIHTQLTREFDSSGVNLSGGEAQKIAIARIFAKPCDVVILDEPSSALDPVSEYELNQIMLSAVYDKTVIFISHRLSATKMADMIYMLEDGEVIERGSHAELMAQGGKYAEMFAMQAEKYNIREELVV